MALLKELNGIKPQWGNNCYFAENATIIGNVVIGDDCSVWFNAVIRGDVHSIKIGNKVNVQDGAILHATYKLSPLNIGNLVSIGHRAIVHGCTIEDNVLIGMGAIVMDNVVVKKNVIIGAGAVVTENTVLESNAIYAGIPAKKIKDLDEKNVAHLLDRISNNYVLYASWYKEEIV